jgi:hypothetical protein
MFSLAKLCQIPFDAIPLHLEALSGCCMQEHIYEQKQKEESREGSVRSAKCKSAKFWKNPVAPNS